MCHQSKRVLLSACPLDGPQHAVLSKSKIFDPDRERGAEPGPQIGGARCDAWLAMLLPAVLSCYRTVVRSYGRTLLHSASRQRRPHAAPQALTWCPVQRLAVTTALPHVSLQAQRVCADMLRQRRVAHPAPLLLYNCWSAEEIPGMFANYDKKYCNLNAHRDSQGTIQYIIGLHTSDAGATWRCPIAADFSAYSAHFGHDAPPVAELRRLCSNLLRLFRQKNGGDDPSGFIRGSLLCCTSDPAEGGRSSTRVIKSSRYEQAQPDISCFESLERMRNALAKADTSDACLALEEVATTHLCSLMNGMTFKAGQRRHLVGSVEAAVSDCTKKGRRKNKALQIAKDAQQKREKIRRTKSGR
eukprot:SAG25_NODE_326_length_9730_cov_8.520195_8_plen_357_part_00